MIKYWIFEAYKTEDDHTKGNPFFAKCFGNYNELKKFSANFSVLNVFYCSCIDVVVKNNHCELTKPV
jgi:GH25 family lysozyme M1 (1,4-beta-N-acetylmuramidase)